MNLYHDTYGINAGRSTTQIFWVVPDGGETHSFSPGYFSAHSEHYTLETDSYGDLWVFNPATVDGDAELVTSWDGNAATHGHIYGDPTCECLHCDLHPWERNVVAAPEPFGHPSRRVAEVQS